MILLLQTHIILTIKGLFILHLWSLIHKLFLSSLPQTRVSGKCKRKAFFQIIIQSLNSNYQSLTKKDKTNHILGFFKNYIR